MPIPYSGLKRSVQELFRPSVVQGAKRGSTQIIYSTKDSGSISISIYEPLRVNADLPD
jgi:hypothetical protein